MAAIDPAGARVLVLGGSGELGSRIAGELMARGARVILAGRDADRLRRRATELGPDVPSVLGDLQEPTHARHLVETTVRLLGGIDGVVNAAGVVAFGPLAELSDDRLDELIATNLVGPLRVIREALAHLDGGFVVTISGVVADVPTAGMAAYSAAKAGMSAASAALGRELRRSGVHVLDARPPHTETGLAGRAISGEAPAMKDGLDAAHVAATIVTGLIAGRRELPAEAFSARPAP